MQIINDTGRGLSVLLLCDFLPCHNWMVFATWYSLNKFLPDANFVVACTRRDLRWSLFAWVRKVVPFHYQKVMTTPEERTIHAIENEWVQTPLLVLEPEVVLLHELGDVNLERINIAPFMVGKGVQIVNDFTATPSMAEDFVMEAKSDKISDFVTYGEGWGNFVTSDWIHRLGQPFDSVEHFQTSQMTVNQRRIFKLWQQVGPLFTMLSK